MEHIKNVILTTTVLLAICLMIVGYAWINSPKVETNNVETVEIEVTKTNE